MLLSVSVGATGIEGNVKLATEPSEGAEKAGFTNDGNEPTSLNETSASDNDAGDTNPEGDVNVGKLVLTVDRVIKAGNTGIATASGKLLADSAACNDCIAAYVTTK